MTDSRSGALVDVAARGVLSQFWAGASLGMGGVGFTFRNGALLRRALVPMAVQVAIFALLVALALHFLAPLTAWLSPAPGHWYSFLGVVVEIALAILLVLAAALGTMIAAGVVCDPFYDALSEKTESILLGRSVATKQSVGETIAGIARELLATAVRLLLYLAGQVPLFLVGLTGVGSVVTVPLGLLWTWLFVAAEVLSRSQGRHGIGAGARVPAAFKFYPLALGFGAAGWLLTFVPLTTPFLVVGGTRLFLSLAAHDRVTSSLTDEDKARLRGVPDQRTSTPSL